MMTMKTTMATLMLAATLAGCIPTDRPTTATRLQTVEQQKKDIAELRNRRLITYEEAARRQFEIERASYALTTGELDFWRVSIEYARMVDDRQITVAEYNRRRDIAYAQYAAPPA